MNGRRGLGPAGRFIAGDIGLPHEPPAEQEMHGDRVSFDAHFRNQRVRVVAIHREIAGSPFVFVTAETTRKRDQLAVDLAVARLLADRLMVMRRSRVVEAGLTDQILDDPQHPYSQLLVSSVLQP